MIELSVKSTNRRPRREQKGSLVKLTPQASKAGIQKKSEASISKKAGSQKKPELTISKALQKELEAGISNVQIQEEPEASISKAEIQQEPEVCYLVSYPNYCECCLKKGHRYNKCPYRLAVKKGTKVGRRWAVVCHCCLRRDAHPPEENVRLIATKVYCGRCHGHDHMYEDCSLPPPPGFTTRGLCFPGLRNLPMAPWRES